MVMVVITQDDQNSGLFQDRPVNHIVSHAEFNPRNLGKPFQMIISSTMNIITARSSLCYGYRDLHPVF